MRTPNTKPFHALKGNAPIATSARDRNKLRARFAQLQRLWNFSREESRRVAASAQETRRLSRELVKQWAEVAAQTRELRTLSRRRWQGINSYTPPAARYDRPVVATARRVPWRRLQMDEVEGAVEIWIAPGYEEI